MRFLLSVAISLFFCLASMAQPVQTSNNQLIGYQEFPTVISSHATDAAGNQYFTGFFRGQLTINNEAITTGNGLEDVFWAKTNPSGKLMSYRTYGSAFPEIAPPNSMAMGADNRMLFGLTTQQPITIAQFSVVPYTNALGAPVGTGCLVYADTSGAVSWVKRTNLQNFRIYYGHNLFHLVGQIFQSQPSIKIDDSTVIDSVGLTGFVHIMLDKTGTILGVKTITARKPAQSVSFIHLAHFSDNSLLLQYSVNGDSSYRVNDKVVLLPNTFTNHQFIVRVDTAYKNFRQKLMNPQRQTVAGLANSGLPVCVGPNDSIYAVIHYENTTPLLTYDGISFMPQTNTFAVFDTLLVAKRQVVLGNSVAGYYPSHIYKRKIYFRSIIYHDGQFYLNGAYTGTNESPMNTIPRKDTIVKILPGVTATIDQNGPSRGFVARIDRNLSQANIIPAEYQWYGDHSPYESMIVLPSFVHPAGPGRFAFVQNTDNVWNPWIIGTDLTVISGTMQRNADMPEMPQMVQFFNDGSRLIVGYARGKTAFDSAGSTFITNGGRRDMFMVRIRANNQVAWYKRFYSTLTSPEIRKVEIRNGKAWFLVNFFNSLNDSNYIKTDTEVFRVGTLASLMGYVDTAGSLKITSLPEPVLSNAYLRDFSFFNNGDLALVTSSGLIPQSGFVDGLPGVHFFRQHPVTGAILDRRKITGNFLPNISSLQVDKQNQLYAVSSEGGYPSPYTLTLHNPSGPIDFMNVSYLPTQPQYALTKLDWNDIKWIRRSAGGGFLSGKPSGNLLLTNDLPVLVITSAPNSQPVSWDGKPIHSGVTSLSFSLAALDSAGVLQKSKTIEGLMIQSTRTANGQFYLSGQISKAIKVDTIPINHAGGFDGLSLILDSTLTAKRSFRVASVYAETMLDTDVFSDSVIALAYTAQGDPQLYGNRMAINTSDYEEDAYLGSITLHGNIVTSISNPSLPLPVQISPNPVTDHTLRLQVGVIETLRAECSVYQSNGQHVTSVVTQFHPGNNWYSLTLPAEIGGGVYHVVIRTKKWTTTKTFIVL